MFEESLVVQSAVSAFNNAALAGPAFFWLGLLMAPLFFVAYKYGNRFLGMIGWERDSLQMRVIKWTVGLSVVWMVLFGGNYDVLRDAETVLPFITAAVAFMGMCFVGFYTRDVKLPGWKSLSRREKFKTVFLCAIILAIIGLTDIHTWWGPILQIAAFVGGLLFGRRMKYNLRPVPFISGFLLLFTVMILMQPEFFRYGQLGNLTWMHLVGVLAVGLPIIDMVVLRNTKPTGKIYHSAFVKLKWMLRCLVALSGVLFVMTESVPVFIALCVLVAGLAWLNVVHSHSVPGHLADRLLMIAIFNFGVLTIMPVISILAILGWVSLPRGDIAQELRRLL